MADWQAPSPAQEALRAEFLAHIDRHPNGWARRQPGVHLTASALVCSPDASAVVLMLHRKLGRWLQMGGHIEPADGSLAGAALREATEESGLSGLLPQPGIVHLDRHEVPCGPVQPCFHLDVRYLILADPAEAPVLNNESEQVSWFDSDRLPTVDRSVTDLISAARRRLGGTAH